MLILSCNFYHVVNVGKWGAFKTNSHRLTHYRMQKEGGRRRKRGGGEGVSSRRRQTPLHGAEGRG
jgi:hypothetical protein